MKQSRFTDEQIFGFLKQADAGISVKDLCRSGGMETSDAAKLRELEAKNNKRKKLLGSSAKVIVEPDLNVICL